MKANKTNFSVILSVLIPLVSGLILLALSMKYEDCDWTNTNRIAQCANIPTEKVLFWGGIILLVSAILIPVFREKHQEKLELPKITK